MLPGGKGGGPGGCPPPCGPPADGGIVMDGGIVGGIDPGGGTGGKAPGGGMPTEKDVTLTNSVTILLFFCSAEVTVRKSQKLQKHNKIKTFKDT